MRGGVPGGGRALPLPLLPTISRVPFSLPYSFVQMKVFGKPEKNMAFIFETGINYIWGAVSSMPNSARSQVCRLQTQHGWTGRGRSGPAGAQASQQVCTHQPCTPTLLKSPAHQSCTPGPVLHTQICTPTLHQVCTPALYTQLSPAHPALHTHPAHQLCPPSPALQPCTPSPVLHTQLCTPTLHQVCTPALYTQPSFAHTALHTNPAHQLCTANPVLHTSSAHPALHTQPCTPNPEHQVCTPDLIPALHTRHFFQEMVS